MWMRDLHSNSSIKLIRCYLYCYIFVWYLYIRKLCIISHIRIYILLNMILILWIIYSYYTQCHIISAYHYSKKWIIFSECFFFFQIVRMKLELYLLRRNLLRNGESEWIYFILHIIRVSMLLMMIIIISFCFIFINLIRFFFFKFIVKHLQKYYSILFNLKCVARRFFKITYFGVFSLLFLIWS